MSTQTPDEGSHEMHDPTKDKYLEVDKRVVDIENEVIAEIAYESKAIDHAIEAVHKQARSAIEDIRSGRDKTRR